LIFGFFLLKPPFFCSFIKKETNMESLLEQQRKAHEEIERVEQVIVN